MKKTMICLAVALSVCMAFTGCGKKDSSANTKCGDYVTVGEYKGVEVQKPSADVTEDEIAVQIQKDLQTQQTEEDVNDRGIENGDKVNMDYAGTREGVAFEGGTAEAQDIVIGSNSFIEGFESGLIGAKTGEQVTLDLTFPDPYPGNTELSGVAVQFAVTVNSIKKVILPELTDEVVQKISTDVKTVDEYKAKVKTDLEAKKASTAENAIAQLAWGQAMAKAEVVKYVDGDVDKTTQEMTDYYTKLAESENMSFADYLEKRMMMTEADFKTKAVEASKQQLKEKMATKLIAQKEKIAVTAEEYDAAVAVYAKNVGAASVEEFEKQYGKEMIETTILSQKVMDFIVENAAIK